MKGREQLLLSEGVGRMLISGRGGSLHAALSLAAEHGWYEAGGGRSAQHFAEMRSGSKRGVRKTGLGSQMHQENQ
jgi:hypothetical protein